MNWFRKNAEGRRLGLGFGENSRVFKWGFERVTGTGQAAKTPIGMIPAPDALDLSGLDISPANVKELLRVNAEEWKKEAENAAAYFSQYGEKLPALLNKELQSLKQRLDQTL